VSSASIVGAGIFGASLAYRLVRDGWDVTLYERHEPGHERAASGGESRLIRFSHGSDAWYTRSALRARDLWRELEVESGRELFVECGVLWLGRREDGWEAASEVVLREEGVPVERLQADEGERFFPSFEQGDLEFLLWEPEAGVLRAAEATMATAEAAQNAGVRLVQTEALPGQVEGDVVVWACGAWLLGLFPGLVPLRVTRQSLFFVRTDDRWRASEIPAWVDYDRAAEDEAQVAALAYAAERFPALRDATVASSKICPYALTPDTNFIVAPHPELGGNWILGGGSGHGFKHGPALAEYAARVISAEERPDERFGLGPRRGGPSLRTAGTT